MPIKDIVATVIKAERETKGLSQDRVAAKADLSTRYYRSVENGEKMPSIKTAFKISKAFDLHYTKILEPVWEHWLNHPNEDS